MPVFHSLRALLLAGLAFSALACASTTPMIGEVPPGKPLPIDGVWRDPTPNARFQIGAGRIWALEAFTSGIWRVKPGQVEVVNLRRTGPRTYEGWHSGYQGPYYLSLLDHGRMALLLRTKLFGDYQTVLLNLSFDDPQALAAEMEHPEPAIPSQNPDVVARMGPPGQSSNLDLNSNSNANVRPAAAPRPPVAAVPPTGLAIPSGADFGRYHALLIGNNRYRHLPKLVSAEADVEEVSKVLEDRYGFETTILEDASRDDVLLALERYRRTLTEGDNLLIYYAGHGWLDEDADEGYWLPVDAQEDSAVNWIPNATLTSSFKAIRAKHVLVVADSCYSGKLTRGIRVQGARPPDYLTRMAEKRARMVISSGGLEPVLDGGGGGHSVFAAAFLSALRENRGVLDTTSLFSRIRRDVMLHADQTPELADIRKSGHEGGDFLFVPKD